MTKEKLIGLIETYHWCGMQGSFDKVTEALDTYTASIIEQDRTQRQAEPTDLKKLESALLTLIDECPSISLGADSWLTQRIKETFEALGTQRQAVQESSPVACVAGGNISLVIGKVTEGDCYELHKMDMDLIAPNSRNSEKSEYGPRSGLFHTNVTQAVQEPAYNPWREPIENILKGDNYFRASEWGELLADLDRLYAAPQPAQVPEWDEPRIRALATDTATKVASNAGAAPQVCFPHIYLSLKEALLTDSK